MSEDQESKTEEPTSRKISKAREQGQVAVSRDMAVFAMLTASTAIVFAVLPLTSKSMLALMRRLIEQAGNIGADNQASILAIVSEVVWRMAVALAAPFAILVFCAIASTMAQTGLLISSSKLAPKFSTLNPLSGAKRMFSIQKLIDFGKGLLKATVVGFIGYLTIKPQIMRLEPLVGLEAGQVAAILSSMVLHLMIGVLVAIGAVGGLDYFYQRFQLKKQLRMTKEEVKEEHKNAEGDPHIKGKMRQIRMARSRKRMMAAVPAASVVITNPTHYAVALQYEMGTAGAPKVVAKGADFLARRIREVATEHDVPIVENPPVARALYASVELDQEIPPEQYKAVAEIIGYVMRLKRLPRRAAAS